VRVGSSRTGRPPFDRLSAGLGDVKETAALLRKLPAVIEDAEATETAAELAGWVGQLRDALQALGGRDTLQALSGGDG
jgi:hypothetical protein